MIKSLSLIQWVSTTATEPVYTVLSVMTIRILLMIVAFSNTFPVHLKRPAL